MYLVFRPRPTRRSYDLFVDFCVGPHVPSSGRLKAFKLLNTSNAYWKGDARNQRMQRIYGTAFLNDADLKAHRSQEHTSELQSPCKLVCRLLLDKEKDFP